MAQIYNPNTFNNNIDRDKNSISTLSNEMRINREYAPSRRLASSVASTGGQFGNSRSDFDALASDIPDAFATNEQPKLKFLFTASFQPRANLNLSENGADDMGTMRFALKRATRPTPTVVYQDVNYYGLRTKVAVKMDYGTVTLAFYDDVVNRAHSIVSQYLNVISPISLMEASQADNLSGTTGAVTIGAIDHPMGPFSSLTVTHHMLSNGDNLQEIAKGKTVKYVYLNPKVININLDDLDMTQSDSTTVELVFVYDSVNIIYSDNNILEIPQTNRFTPQINGVGLDINNNIAADAITSDRIDAVANSISPDLKNWVTNAGNELTNIGNELGSAGSVDVMSAVTTLL